MNIKDKDNIKKITKDMSDEFMIRLQKLIRDELNSYGISEEKTHQLMIVVAQEGANLVKKVATAILIGHCPAQWKENCDGKVHCDVSIDKDMTELCHLHKIKRKGFFVIE